PPEFRLAEVRPREVRAGEFRLAEVRLTEVRLTEIRLAEVRFVEVRSGQCCLREISPAQVGTDSGVLLAPRVPGAHPLLQLTDVVVVRHAIPSSNNSRTGQRSRRASRIMPRNTLNVSHVRFGSM